MSAGLYAVPTVFASDRSIKIGTYGGYFEDSFKKHVYPEFTKATGIAVESVTQPNSTDWLVTMQQAAASGSAPTDLSLFARDTMIKASRIGGLLAPLDMSQAPSVSNLDEYFLYKSGDEVLGAGCLLYTSPSPRDKRQSRMPSSA